MYKKKNLSTIYYLSTIRSHKPKWKERKNLKPSTPKPITPTHLKIYDNGLKKILG